MTKKKNDLGLFMTALGTSIVAVFGGAYFLAPEEHIQEIEEKYDSILNTELKDTNYINLLNTYVPFEEKEKTIKNLEKDLKN